MRKWLIVIYVLLLLPVACSSITDSHNTNKNYVIECLDGDTCLIMWNGYKEKLRIENLDSPEIDGECEEESIKGIEAKEYLNHKITTAEDIRIEIVSNDRYYRLIGDIWIDGDSVLGIMTYKGYGVVWTGNKHNWCK
jgi:micrococcal nuclease